MATPLAELVVQLRADNAKLRADFNKAAADAKAWSRKVEGEVKKVSGAVTKSSRSILQLRRAMDTAFRGLVGSFVVREVVGFSRGIVHASDSLKLLNQRIKVFTGNSAGFGEAYEAAQKLGVSVNNVAAGMGRIVAVGAEMGVTTREARKMTVTFQQLALLSGSSIKESQAAFIQFTQALSANRLSGEELRSVREQAPLVAQAIAKYMGISVGEIKKVAEEGKITADVMRGAMAAAAEDAAAKFAQLPLTLERQQAALENSWSRALAALDTVTKQSSWWKTINSVLTQAFDAFSKANISPEFMTDKERADELNRITKEIQRFQDQTATVGLSFNPATGGPSDPSDAVNSKERLDALRARRWEIMQAQFKVDLARNLEDEASAAAAATADWNALINAMQAYEVQSQKIEAGSMAGLYAKFNEETRSTLEKAVAEYEEFMVKIEELMALGPDMGGITTDTANARIQDYLDLNLEEVKVTAEKIFPKPERTQLSIMAEEAARNIQDSFADFLFDPFEKGLKGMLAGFLDTIRRMVAEAASAMILQELFGFLGTSIGGGVGGFFSSMASSIGKRAYGGSVSANRAYVVGERGPELLTGVNGKIVPGTDISGGGGMTIAPTYNIDARGATQDLAKQLPSILAAHARQTVEMARRAINDDVSRGAFGRA